MKHEIKLHSHSIVAVGDLNPAIFQPAWFAGEGLISRGEAQAATVQMISAQAALFEVDWLSVQVLPERFVATTTNEAFFQHLHDFVAATFSHYDVADDGPGCRTMLRILNEEWSAAVSSESVLRKFLVND